MTTVTIEIDSLHDGQDFSIRLSRAKFEQLTIDYFKKAMDPVSQCLQDSGLPKSKIHEVVLVGGSTRIPKVQELIKAFFNGKEPCKSINPDEAVAYGAAVQAAIVSGVGGEQVQNMVLLDVAPLSLGLEMAGGMMQKLIDRNTTIPTNKSQEFSTAEDYQEHVDIKVYEGERGMVKDNNFLGTFTLKGIPRTLRGVPKIKVTFNIDSNGILEVTAEDVKTHNKGTIQITNEKGRLTQAEIERMLAEAEQYKGEDDLARSEIVARESLKIYVQRVERSLAEFEEDKIPKKARTQLETKLTDLNDWILTAGPTAAKEDCEERQKDLEAAWNTIMVRINNAAVDFWEHRAELPEGEKFIEEGGFFLETGLDIRELIEDPD